MLIDRDNSEATVEPARLGRFARSILVALGTPDALSEVVADHLVGAHLAGHDSHGVQLLPYYADLVARGKLHPAASTTVITDTGSLVVLDGHDGWGQVTAKVASDLAAERALAHGVCCRLRTSGEPHRPDRRVHLGARRPWPLRDHVRGLGRRSADRGAVRGKRPAPLEQPPVARGAERARARARGPRAEHRRRGQARHGPRSRRADPRGLDRDGRTVRRAPILPTTSQAGTCCRSPATRGRR